MDIYKKRKTTVNPGPLSDNSTVTYLITIVTLTLTITQNVPACSDIFIKKIATAVEYNFHS